MPIQDPHAVVKRQEGGQVAYKAVPFDEPQPAAFQRKPPVLQQHDRKDFPSNSQYQKAVTAAQKQYEAENTAYQAEKAEYNKAMEGWQGRKAAWDAKEEGKVNASGAGQQRLTDYLKTPEGRKQLEFNNQMLTYPFLPAALVATQIGKGMRGPVSKVGYGLLEAGAGEGLGYLERQNQPKKYEDPAGYYQNEAYQNFLQSTGLGAGVGSIRAALLKPHDPNAQSGGLFPWSKGTAAAAPPAAPPPPPPPVEPYKGTTKDVARLVAHDLGVGGDIGGAEPKSAIVQRSLDAIRNGLATPEQIATATKKAGGGNLEDFLTNRVAGGTRRITGLAGLLGAGAAAAAMAPGKAEASPAERAPASKPKPETSSDLSDLEREYGTGLPKGAAREALKGAAGTALMGTPVLGEAAMTAAAPSLYKPSDEDLADAEYWRRGREEMARANAASGDGQPHASGGSAREPALQTPFINPEQHSFVPEHLPEHERSLLNNPHDAIRRAAWQLPYLATGRHMVQLTGDPNSFFGGHDPETEAIYQRTLAASKAYYDDAFKQLANNKAPIAQEAPTESEAPVARKHGGRVNGAKRKIDSIHGNFEAKLKNKERHVASLERAQKRSGNAKLAHKLNEEKNIVKNIKEHLQNIQKYRTKHT